ncbi:MAG: PorT family protein [Flavobacterium sp.]|jgi:opacity protein-like surface antigen|uniref:porin family protein n=1 Tax=Flavobacterium sp. Leaf359 TaxID=1736351 RepID=UPI0006F45B64|nr:porin family protein [Flavobacterium sp. Leaf359]KQS47758.1 hypothetical protein ASG38_09975 [Flavobacterium sp. Leaf359]MBU7569267.1 PorT family protein [Flavobacterium sp.]PZO33794.1 MAG: PorT family protein [Flavobacteriaceae bacterium]PZQ86101.1 MAG: PorT family protein [Flavobacterium johnsoniae]
MKRRIISSIAIFGFIITSSAQNKGKIEIGFNAGLNSSNATTTYYSAERSISLNLGASADYYLSDSWSLKLKLIYDRKGWDNDFIQVSGFDPIEFPAYERTNVNLNYITVPLMANWHFGSKKNWYLNFGPYIGFLMNAKETRLDTDIKKEFNTVDGGLSLGIGVKIPVSDKLKLFIEYEVQGGMAEIYKNNEEGDKNMNIRSSFNFGINFLLD